MSRKSEHDMTGTTEALLPKEEEKKAEPLK